MFEKLITDLKKSLPEALRKKLGGSDNSDDEQEFEEVEAEEIEAPVESSEEEKKKKMKSMIIKVVVILGLGYFALDEFVLKGMQQESETDIFAQAPKPKRKKVAVVETTTDAVPPTDTTVSSEAPVSEPVVTDTAPIENINVLEKTEESLPKTEEALPTEPIVQVEEQAPVQAEEEVISETKVAESNVDTKLDELVDNVEQTTPNNPIEEIKVPSSGEAVTPPSMASKIVEEITETPPPAYDQVGRGLVYNCKDKYWACLDKPAYVTCNKNQKWNKSKGNPAECAVADIYSSDEDCAKVQKYNVSTSASTAICQQ